MIKNIIFDWSGVLSDDLTTVHKAVMIVFDYFKTKRISKEEFRREFVLPYEKFYLKYIPNIDLEKEKEIFEKVTHEVGEPLPTLGAKEILSFLKEKDMNMIVLSSVPEKKLMVEIENYGFHDFFKRIYGSVINKVDVIKKVIKENDFEPSETIYVGDMVHDIHAAKEVKIKVIAVASGYTPRDKLEKENPDYIINKLVEIKNIIK